MRGTAHWEGDKFVNDYEEVVHGNKAQMRDIFQDITPGSYSLVFVVVKEDGSTEKQIVTRAVRRLRKAAVLSSFANSRFGQFGVENFFGRRREFDHPNGRKSYRSLLVRRKLQPLGYRP